MISYEILHSSRMIDVFFRAHVNARPYLFDTYVYFPNEKSRFISANESIKIISEYFDARWFDRYYTSEQRIWSERRVVKRYETEFTVISLYERYMNRSLIVHNIRAEYFTEMLQGLVVMPEQRIFIQGEDGKLLVSSGNQQDDEVFFAQLAEEMPQDMPAEGQFMVDGVRYVVYTDLSSQNNWRYFLVYPNSIAMRPITIGSQILIALALILIMVCLFFAYRISRRNYDSIRSIISLLGTDTLEEVVRYRPSKTDDEYTYIVQRIIENFVTKEYLTVQLSEKKYRMISLELYALQSQINPHFLFNTLESINWQAVTLTGAPNQVNTMVSDLSQLLRCSLTDPMEPISLEQEIENTKCYIRLQKQRYKNSFDVTWSYDYDFQEVRCLKLILQPLLENSIIHGTKGLQRTNRIAIRIYRRGEALYISMRDTGVGIESERLSQIQAQLKALEGGDMPEYDHIGLGNIKKRLRLFYGEKSDLTIGSVQGKGTCIHIIIPLTGMSEIEWS